MTTADTAMMLGAGVLIATQVVLVLVAVLWYIRSQRTTGPQDDNPHGQRPGV